jgi:hypothetical protein
VAVRLAERWLAGHVNAETWQASIVPLAPMHAVDETSRTREASRGTGRPWAWRGRPTGASNAGNSSNCMSSLAADSPCYDAAARQTKRGRAVGVCTAKQEQARAVQGTRSPSSHPPPGGAGRPGGHPQEPVAAGPQGTVASLLQLRPEHQSICVCCCDPARMVRLCHGRTLAAPRRSRSLVRRRQAPPREHHAAPRRRPRCPQFVAAFRQQRSTPLVDEHGRPCSPCEGADTASWRSQGLGFAQATGVECPGAGLSRGALLQEAPGQVLGCV